MKAGDQEQERGDYPGAFASFKRATEIDQIEFRHHSGHPPERLVDETRNRKCIQVYVAFSQGQDPPEATLASKGFR
jgi:hypothetical protein